MQVVVVSFKMLNQMLSRWIQQNQSTNCTIYQIPVTYLTWFVRLRQRGTCRQAEYRKKYPTTQQKNISLAALHPLILANKSLAKWNRRLQK